MFIEEYDVLDFDTKGSVHETEDNINHTNVMIMMQLSSVANLTSVSYEFLQTSYIKPLPPMREKVFSSMEADELKQIYRQLYPSQTLSFFSLLMHHKKVLLGNELLKSGEVVMAYWPGIGNSLSDIDYSTCRVGIVNYFLNHTIKLDNNEKNRSHLFCYITWKQRHPMSNWFGKSAIVSSTLNEIKNGCCYMPIQCMAFR